MSLLLEENKEINLNLSGDTLTILFGSIPLSHRRRNMTLSDMEEERIRKDEMLSKVRLQNTEFL